MDLLNSLDIPSSPVVPSAGTLRPLGLDQTRITGGFWGHRREINRTATLPHILHWLEKEGWLPNFDLAAAGTLPTGRRGREFADSEVYKYLEAVAWQLGSRPDTELERIFRSIVERVAAAQDADGYLNTNFGRPGQGARWSDLEWGHELYCAGHLFQAGIARERTRPGSDDGLIDIARKCADLICDVFGEDGNQGVCGHPEVETALAELGRALHEPRYLAQAALFIARRGHHTLRDIEWGRSYYQDDLPVRDTAVLHGHAVRANYLAAGAVDVAVETGDTDLLDSLRRQWDRTVATRTYLTGGQGAHHQDEAFGTDFELPPDRAYSETCAGIGSIMFSWRLLLATGDERYADLIERILFNVVATSPSPDGRAFYYSNTLHQRERGIPADPAAASPRASASLRAPWFEVSCCPPNVARTLASLAGYLATISEAGIQLHNYAPAQITTTLADGTRLHLRVETTYPLTGVIRVHIDRTAATPWTLRLRVPAWATGTTLEVISEHDPIARHDVPTGAVGITRTFVVGDTVELTLPMRPRITRPDPRIDAIRDCIAIERGPEVLCLESLDLPTTLTSTAVDDVAVVPHAEPKDIDGAVRLLLQDRRHTSHVWPYIELEQPPVGKAAPVPLIPYHQWANRGPSTMRIWLPLH